MTTYNGVDTYPASLTLPDDTAPPTAAEINPILEGLADRTTYLLARTGAIYLLNEHKFIAASSDATVLQTWTDTAYNTAHLVQLGLGGGGFTVAVGDIMETEITWTSAFAPAVAGPAEEQFFARLVSKQGSAAIAEVPGSEIGQGVVNLTGSPWKRNAITMRGHEYVTTAGTYLIALNAYVEASGAELQCGGANSPGNLSVSCLHRWWRAHP